MNFRPGHTNNHRPPQPKSTDPEIIYGRHAVEEVLRRNSRDLFTFLHTPAFAESPQRQRIESMLPADLPREALSHEKLASRVGSPDHQGVALVVSPYRYAPESALAEATGFYLALDGITDPMNMGAILRSARCAGVTGVLLPENYSAPVNPTVVKASAGAVESLAVHRIRNLVNTLATLHERGFDLQVAESQAKTRGLALPAEAFTTHSWAGNSCLIVGSEGEGVRRAVLRVAQGCVYIPMVADFDSLNVSAATAVLLFGIRGLREA